MKLWAEKQKGFTIVELLIVVVVIAILAAIVIVAYNGIQSRAKDAAVKSALANASRKIGVMGAANSDTYPLTKSEFLSSTNLLDSASLTYEYIASSSGKQYCVSLTNTQTSPQISYATTHKTSSPIEGKCVTNDVRTPFPVGGAGAWTGYNAAGGNSASYTAAALDGRDAYRWTAGAAGFAASTTVGLEYTGTSIPVVAGVEISPAIHVRSSKAGSYRIHQNSRNSTTDLGTVTGTTVAVPALTWVKLSGGKFTPPATADRMSIRAQYMSGTTWASGDWIEVTQVSTNGGDITYGDGLSEHWSWVGTANNSSSFGPAK